MKLLRRSTALLLSCAIVLGLVASGFLIRAIADTAMQWYNADYDALSRFYEIGASYDLSLIHISRFTLGITVSSCVISMVASASL